MTKPLLETNSPEPENRGSGLTQSARGVRGTTISVAKSPSTSAMVGSSLPVPDEAGALKITSPVAPSYTRR
jgi:hypothetical protein